MSSNPVCSPLPKPYRSAAIACLPAFHPVPVAKCADRWQPEPQVDFIVWLAQTRSVLERGPYLASYRKDDKNALAEAFAHFNRGHRKRPGLGDRSERLEPAKCYPDE